MCGGNDIVFFTIVLDLVDYTLKLFHLWTALFHLNSYVYYISCIIIIIITVIIIIICSAVRLSDCLPMYLSIHSISRPYSALTHTQKAVDTPQFVTPAFASQSVPCHSPGWPPFKPARRLDQTAGRRNNWASSDACHQWGLCKHHRKHTPRFYTTGCHPSVQKDVRNTTGTDITRKQK